MEIVKCTLLFCSLVSAAVASLGAVAMPGKPSGTGEKAFDTIAADQFEVAEDLEVSVWATTPQLYNPTNFDVDAEGRIWVTEAVNYREFRNGKTDVFNEGGDRVVVLTDSDGDGQADDSHTFVRDPDLLAPLGIAVVDNQIIVSCSPNLLIYTDVDRDTKFDPAVDKKEVFLTGFEGKDHDHSLHSVTVGPDGYWYFNVGNGGAHTVTDKSGWTLRAGSSYHAGNPFSKANVPGRKSDDGRVWVGGVALRIKPDGTGMQPIGHNFRNSYEQTVTSFGDVFQNDNDDPPACRTTWLMEYGNAGFASADGERSWRVDQRPGQSVRVAEWRQEDPGTMPAGDVYGNGAPTGIAYYENGSLDSVYGDGLLLSCESARGVVFGYVPQPQGAGFSLQRFDFLKLKETSGDQGWFRPSDVAVGPDGAIYVADWYDPGVGGHRMSDTTGSGTIYRIAPRGFKPAVPELDLGDAQGRIDALCNPAPSVRALGFEALKQAGADSLPALKQLLQHDNRFLAARAIWLLPYAGPEGIDLVNKQLQSEYPQTRIAALRSMKRAGLDWTQHASTLADDPSPAVRRELALSLRDVAWEKKRELVAKLAQGYDGWDRWYLEALGTAVEGNEAAAYQLLIAEKTEDPIQWDRPTAEIAWRLHPVESIDHLAQRAMAESLPLDRREPMLTALGFIPDRRAAEQMLKIAKQGPEDLRPMAAWWGHNLQQGIWKPFDMASQFPAPPRVRASRHGEGEPTILFDVAGETVFETEVGETGKSVNVDVEVAGARRLYLLVDGGGKDGRQRWLADWIDPVLTGDDGGSLTSMTWLSASQIDKSDAPRVGFNADRGPLAVDGFDQPNGIGVRPLSTIAYDLEGRHVERFQATVALDEASVGGDGPVRFRVKVDRSEPVVSGMDLGAITKLSGVASHGKALFFSSKLGCSRCHMVDGYGGEIGPDLTEIASKHARPVLVEAIVKPSAAISTGFETISVVTLDGLMNSGLLISNGDPVVIKDAEGKLHSISRDDIDMQKDGTASLMPEMEKLLTVQETADLVAFLEQTAKAASGR